MQSYCLCLALRQRTEAKNSCFSEEQNLTDLFYHLMYLTDLFHTWFGFKIIPYNVYSLPWGKTLSTVGDILSAVGNAEYRGEYHGIMCVCGEGGGG